MQLFKVALVAAFTLYTTNAIAAVTVHTDSFIASASALVNDFSEVPLNLGRHYTWYPANRPHIENGVSVTVFQPEGAFSDQINTQYGVGGSTGLFSLTAGYTSIKLESGGAFDQVQFALATGDANQQSLAYELYYQGNLIGSGYGLELKTVPLSGYDQPDDVGYMTYGFSGAVFDEVRLQSNSFGAAIDPNFKNLLAIDDVVIAAEPLDIASSVTVEALDKTMQATFQPSNGLGLDAAASALGFDHFNWVQVITHYDGLLWQPIDEFPFARPISLATPFIDPPAGGFVGHPADTLPFYWDEGEVLNLDYHLSANTIGDLQLQFRDSPTLSLPGRANFTTSLVGVKDGGEWVPLYTFEWETDNFLDLVGGVGTTRALEALPGSMGGITHFAALTDPTDVSQEVYDLWRANGALISVPEPATWALLIGGFGFAGAALRRQRYAFHPSRKLEISSS